MDSRREFLKKAALLAAGSGAIPASISRALAIDPKPGTTFLDAEHVVILMQENRSFDHCYGTLRGVRGFDDPRAVTLPGGNPVWLQTNKAGETYAPFRMSMRESKATWIGSLPHGWVDQSQARNEGRHDRWLDWKASGSKPYATQPLTLGYYTREDVPFYHALADAFTICDQNFCSSLTGTTPNRLHLWTGTLRARPEASAKACVRNEDADLDTLVSWRTFPERLEAEGVSWCVYQNELTVASGFDEDSDSWLANYGDNPLEYLTQYGVQYSKRHLLHLEKLVTTLPAELAKLEATPKPWPDALAKQVRTMRGKLAKAQRERKQWTAERFNSLPAEQKSIHRKAFVTNEADLNFRELAEISYSDQGVERTMHVPKGDVFHQFREDVRTGKLPTVSWIVAPERFSDHPSAPWYGAWYVSEALDILTKNPDVWRKTIFILCYDENDGYFDHVPPFVAPHPARPATGKASASITDLALEHVRPEQEMRNGRIGPWGFAGPVGLGYRVPLVVASPWSRGGYVCSQVFDHTSMVQLIEKILSQKNGRQIRETNINSWRRAVCGDMTSIFRPYDGGKIEKPVPVERVPFLESIHQAQFKPPPAGFKKLDASEIQLAREAPLKCDWLPRQEKGTRPSCALPYELMVDGFLTADRKSITASFAVGREIFGDKAAGAPFHVYSPKLQGTRAYAVVPGDRLEDSWALAEFADSEYQLRVHGPNGFYREFRGNADDPAIRVTLTQDRVTRNAMLRLANLDSKRLIVVKIADATSAPRVIKLVADEHKEIALDLKESRGWYDLRISVDEAMHYSRHYAGRIETGEESVSDPALGKG